MKKLLYILLFFPLITVSQNWQQIGQTISGENIQDGFGYNVSINSQGNRVVIGAPDNDTPYSNAGECKVYEYNGTSWQQLGQDINGYNGNDVFGRSLVNSSQRLCLKVIPLQLHRARSNTIIFQKYIITRGPSLYYVRT